MSGFTLKDLNTNEVHNLYPLEYSTEWKKPVEIEVEMANGNIKIIRKPVQQDKFTITEENITSSRYTELYNIWSKRSDRLFLFTDPYGNQCNVRVFSLREPAGRYQGFHTAVLTFIVKERLGGNV